MADNTEVISSEEHITAFDRFLKDGVANRENYHRWHSNVMVIVPTNSYVLVRKRFDKNRIYVENEGTIFLNPLFDEYLFAPANSTSIDYEPIEVYTSENIAVTVDPVVTLRIVDPITYYKSSNTTLADLKDVISSVLRGYATTRTMNEIRATQEYSLNNQAFATLINFETKYGLKVEQIRNKSITIPKEIEKASVATKTAEEDARKAEKEEMAALIRAKARMALPNQKFDAIRRAQELGIDVSYSTEILNREETTETVKSAQPGVNVIISNANGNNNGNYIPEWFFLARQHGMINGDNKSTNNQVVVDEDGNGIEEEQGRGRTKKR